MKLLNKLLLAACLVTLTVIAATPSYVTKSDGGNASAGAEVIFPSDPTAQIRIVGLNWQSDSNTAVVSFTTGEGAYRATATNTSSGVTQVLNSVSGLAANDILVLERAGVGYAATLSSTNSGTNAVLASGGWGVAPRIGDNVYKMSSATTIPVGATTNAQNGEAIYVGNWGRPVRAVLTPAAVTNRLNSVTARYE